MSDLVNEFSWSHSRGELFAKCKRAYYLSYYAAWGGWDRRSSHLGRTAYRLKKLDNRWAWAGHIIHAVISRSLLMSPDTQVPIAIEAERRTAWALEVFRAEYKSSKDGRRDRKNDRGFWGLLEHEYSEDVPKEKWTELWAATRAALTWFFSSGWVERVRAAGERVLELDTGTFDGSAHFFADGVKVWAVPDLALMESGAALAVDWKSGQPKPSHLDQLAGHALYLAAKYGDRGVALDSTRATIVYLGGKCEQVVDVSPAALREFSAKLHASVVEMRALLASPEENEPMPMEAAFEMTADTKQCQSCAFRRLCGRET